jgi:hypothetical protein
MRIFSSLFAFLLISPSIFSQSLDTIQYPQLVKAQNYSQDLYRDATVESQYLYNGAEYFVYDSGEKEHQFFESEDWEESMLEYDGQFYRSIPLLYDIFKDEVIIDHWAGLGKVKLQNEKLSSFSLLNHRFIRLTQESSGLQTGFYDLLYEGKTQFVARRAKDRQESVSQSGVEVHFYPIQRYYILKDSKYQEVTNKASVLRLMKDHQKEIKKFLRENGIYFRADRESAIAKMTAYYDQLTHP